nr:hypothetical protein [Fretibacterium sp.]
FRSMRGFGPCGMGFGQDSAPAFRGQGGRFFGQHSAPFRSMRGFGPCGMGFGQDSAPAFRGQGGRFFGQHSAPFRSMRGFGPCGMGFGRDRCPAFESENRGMPGERFQHRSLFSQDMPQEIRTKVSEAAKLRIDLEDILSRKPLNREKALELHGKIGSLQQEIRAWRFEQKLNRIEEFRRNPGTAEKSELSEEK